MGDRTGIEWTDATWNPVHGCSKVSPGCANCYAEALSLRFGHTAAPWTPANAEANVQLKPDRLTQPLRWRDPRMVFVNSMSDLFHELVPEVYIAAVFAVMRAAPRHTFQVLTKRPDRMRDLLSDPDFDDLVGTVGAESFFKHACLDGQLPLRNVWLGTSIENRRYVNRADALRATPAAVRFISAEPLLGPLIFDGVAGTPRDLAHHHHSVRRCWYDGFDGPELNLEQVDWLIAGGESGAGCRPMNMDWARDLRDACAASGTAFFLKQLGGRPDKRGGEKAVLDGRRHVEMPAGMAVAA